jgi:hypothetical protein
MLLKIIRQLIQLIGVVTVGVLSFCGLAVLLGGGTTLAEMLGRPQASTSAVPIPTTFNYQGVLRNADGSLAQGWYTITAKIYAAASGGTALYTETFTSVQARDGLFNVVLGDSPGSQDLQGALGATPRYVGITLYGSSEIIPRQRVHGVPWALYATNAAQAADFTASGNLVVSRSVTVGGGVQVAGNVTATKFNGAIGALNTTGSMTVGGNISWTGHLMGLAVTGPITVVHATGSATLVVTQTLGSMSNRLCWLSETYVEDAGGTGEGGGCSVTLGPDPVTGPYWWLNSNTTRYVTTECAAYCVTW